jgi:hypothetical protein
MSRVKPITLDCGIDAEVWENKDYTSIDISLIDLYNGNGVNNSLKRMAELFTELSEKGFVGNGISRDIGYYDSTDDLILNVTKSKTE